MKRVATQVCFGPAVVLRHGDPFAQICGRARHRRCTDPNCMHNCKPSAFLQPSMPLDESVGLGGCGLVHFGLIYSAARTRKIVLCPQS
jgi:hypothetical protein